MWVHSLISVLCMLKFSTLKGFSVFTMINNAIITKKERKKERNDMKGMCFRINLEAVVGQVVGRMRRRTGP